MTKHVLLKVPLNVHKKILLSLRIMEGLGTSFIESIMVLVQFIPILFGLSVGIPIFFLEIGNTDDYGAPFGQ